MVEFKSIEINDKELITAFLFPSGIQVCDLSFSNLCCWQFYNGGSYAVENGQLVLCFTFSDKTNFYTFAAWNEQSVEIINRLKKQVEEEGNELMLWGAVSDMQPILEKYYPGQFDYGTDRNYADYIYERQSLVELKGKKLQSKRNHVNRFMRENSYTYVPLTPEILPLCLELEAKWCIEHKCDEHASLQNERKALIFAINHFEELGLSGGAIEVEGEIVAFTFGSPINHSTFDIQVEKGNTALEGIYSIINKEFASRLPEQYVYLNREEDLGMEGLRKAKLSYQPIRLLDKALVTINRD